MKTISIVVPNYNGLKLLKENIRHVTNLVNKNKQIKEIIVVDDASTDTSVDFLNSKYPQITVIRKAINSGFSESVNIGFTKARADLVLLLNTDVIPQINIIDILTPYFADNLVFAVGCLEKSYEGNKIIDRGRGIGIFEKGFLRHKKGTVSGNNTLWVSGGSSMFNKKIWDYLGGLDLLFGPFYWEDIDISYRALKCGYKLYFSNKAVINHKHEQGSIMTHYSKDFVSRVAFRNQIMFVWKNISQTDYIFDHIFYLFYDFIIYLITSKTYLISSYLYAFKKLPRILKERSILKKKWRVSDSSIFNLFKKEYLEQSKNE